MEEGVICRTTHDAFWASHYLGQVYVQCVCMSCGFRELSVSFPSQFLVNTLFVLNFSALKQLCILVGVCNVLLTGCYCLCRACLRKETSERIRCSLVVNGKRAKEVVGEGRGLASVP